ncbi:MAG: alpha/beta hydrolase [Ktedonobacteraceae bacterium]
MMNDAQPHLSPEQVAVVKSYRRIEDLIPSRWSEGDVLANGIRHHYYRSGSKKPQLILLHGLQESALCWLRVAKVLEHDYDIILVDARGHGRSDRISSGFSPELLAEDAAGVIRALKLERPAVLGFSMGGSTAIRLAATHPDLVRILLVGGLHDKQPDGQAILRAEGYQTWYKSWLTQLESLKIQTHEERLLSTLTQLPPGSPLPSEDEFVPMVDASAHVDIDMVRLSNELWSQAGVQFEETKEQLQRITCPVLLMYSGTFPVPGAPQTLREEPSARANVKIIHFENAGHVLHRDRFEQFIAVVKTFLKEL